MTSDTEAPGPILTINPDALAKVLEVRAGEDEPDSLVLWVEVNGQQAGAYTYLMEFRARAELPDEVVVQHHDDLSVAIPSDSVEKLRGATLELSGGETAVAEAYHTSLVSPFCLTAVMEYFGDR